MTLAKTLTDTDAVVDVDASVLQFVDPFGLTLLGACTNELRSCGIGIRVHGLQEDIGRYLQRMDVFSDVEFVDCLPSPSRRHRREDSLVELHRLENPRDVDLASVRLAAALVGMFPGVDPNEEPDPMSGYRTSDHLAELIQYCLSELLENALTHARRAGYGNACVWVAAQYYRSSGTVGIGVVDNGAGFLNTLMGNPELREHTNLAAILAAIKPRVSCNRDLGLMGDSVNQGVGLTTVLRIAQRAGGKVMLVSGDAVYDTVKYSAVFGAEAHWQGVAIFLELQRDRLSDVNFRELLPSTDGGEPISLRFE